MSLTDPPLIGIDLMEPARLRDRLHRTPTLRDTIFHPGEVAYSESRGEPMQHLAARFCAKEAVMKALGLPTFDPLDIEVVGGGDESTSVKLRGDAARRAAELGVEVSISMSHLADVAAAVAVAKRSRTAGEG